MIKEQKLKKLKEAIISAVPKILTGGYRIYEIHKQINSNTYWAKVKVGRTITLEDIFKTYQKNKTSNFCPLSISEKGDLVWEKEICYWEFGKPLDQQAPEVIDFLYNLICKR